MMFRLLHPLVVLAACSGVVLTAQDDDYQYLLDDARRKLSAGELSSAEALLDEIVIAQEEEPEGSRPAPRQLHTAHMLFGEIRARRGEYEEALEDIMALPAEFLATRPPMLLRVEVLGRIGRHGEAQALLRELLDRDADDLEARHELGESCWRDGRREEAVALWTANVASSRPESAIQLAALGRSYWRLGGRENLELASRALVDSLRKDSGLALARTVFGTLKFEAYGEAAGFPSGEKDLQKVLDSHGEYEPALLAMYRLRRANGMLDPSKTEKFLSRALAQNPRCVEALVLRASSILDDRRFEDAVTWLEKALAIDDSDRIALSHRASAAWLLGDREGYESYRDRALAGDPGWAEVDRIHADHLVRLYRFADSLPFYEAALAADATDLPSLHGMSRALIYCGEGRRALEQLELAKELAGGINDPWRNNAIAVQELLDSEYTTIENGPFRLTLHRDDAELLATYLMPVHLEAAETLGSRYGL